MTNSRWKLRMDQEGSTRTDPNWIDTVLGTSQPLTAIPYACGPRREWLGLSRAV